MVAKESAPFLKSTRNAFAFQNWHFFASACILPTTLLAKFMLDVNTAIDIGLSVIALYASVKGTTAPFTAPDEDRGKASNDWIRKLGITRLSTVYHLALVVLTGYQCRKIAQLDSVGTMSWQASGTRDLFRLMSIVNILGGGLRVLCFQTLGRFFTFDIAVSRDQKVIQSGPYAIVRHPSYTAMLLHQAGQSFTVAFSPLVPPYWRQRAIWINVALTLFASVSTNSTGKRSVVEREYSSISYKTLINLRIRDEEKMLIAELGQEYKAYMRQVRHKIVPLLF